jgi:hypothetical protein
MFFSDFKKLKSYLKKDYDKIFILRWPRTVLRKDIEKSSLKLKNFLEKYKREKIDIVSFSIGGLITEKAINRISTKINKCILSGAIHKFKLNLRRIEKVYIIESELDIIKKIGNKIYGKTKIPSSRKIKKIILKNIPHGYFSKNIYIYELRKKLYEFYRELLIKNI